MKVIAILWVAALAARLASAASISKYDDYVAKGYRWVIADGPYACVSKEDLWEIVKNRGTETELQTIKQQRAYYLLQGGIVKVVREDVASGMSVIRLPGIPKELWTLTKFLSKHPVENAFGVVETPETSGLVLAGTTRFEDSQAAPDTTPPAGASSLRGSASH
jgi:hypothetical protein